MKNKYEAGRRVSLKHNVDLDSDKVYDAAPSKYVIPKGTHGTIREVVRTESGKLAEIHVKLDGTWFWESDPVFEDTVIFYPGELELIETHEGMDVI
jgi:hypothetical protein